MAGPSRANRCPFAGKATVAVHAPFCSAGCKDRDLLRWLGGDYRMPGPPADVPVPPEEEQS
ncbi:MAG: DNA gyrase inhibitor YacG [Parasphingorhabdus sp.]|nr:DNA gyrase inhibitor YacG [Parasphingorhabdus sp.]